MRRRRTRPLLVLLLLVALAFGGPASADDRTVEDPAGDTPQGLDLKSASHGHNADGWLRHRIVAYNRIGGAGRTLYLEVIAGGDTYEFMPNGEVWKNTHEYPTGPSGHARVTRPTERSIVYEFRRGVIGGPTAYRWRVRAVPMSTNSDNLPNSGRILHDI